MEMLFAFVFAAIASQGFSTEIVDVCENERLHKPILVLTQNGDYTPLSVNTSNGWCVSGDIDNPIWESISNQDHPSHESVGERDSKD